MSKQKNPPRLTDKEKRFLSGLEPVWGWQPIRESWIKTALDVASKGYIWYEGAQYSGYPPDVKYRPPHVKLTKPGMRVAKSKKNNPGWKSWAEEEPVLATATGAGLGSLAGLVGGALVGAPGLGSIAGGAIGGHAGAPKDRKSRGAWGGGIGGLFTPIGAAAGGAIGGRKASRKGNPKEVKKLKNKLLK